MTVRATRTATDLLLHSGVNLKDYVDLRMLSASNVASWSYRWVSYMKSVATLK